MPLIVDSHADLAWNMLNYGRDYTRAAAETRRLEAGSPIVAHNGDSLVGWPDYQRARVAAVFSTLYAPPIRWRTGEWETLAYHDYDEANCIYRDELRLYDQLAESHPDQFRLVCSTSELNEIIAHWEKPSETGHPVGLILLMEGAEAVRSPDELAEWWHLGLRHIGLAWAGTRYCGGTKEPGPLTDDGRRMLTVMAEFNFTLDLSHMDEEAALQALDFYSGPIVVTHANCLALLPNYPTNRHLSDRLIRGVVERGGVIGVIPNNAFLKSGWLRASGSRREEVSLEALAGHIDHICQLSGNARHVGIGSDFDGGFGLQSVPPEIDTIADLQKLTSLLAARGYLETDVAAVLGGNWLTHLRTNLPKS